MRCWGGWGVRCWGVLWRFEGVGFGWDGWAEAGGGVSGLRISRLVELMGGKAEDMHLYSERHMGT